MYYQQTPISEKPETDNWYIMVADSAIPVIRWFDTFYGWDISEIGHGYQHWLKPITGVVMTEEQLKEMWVAAINYENDKRLGRLLNNSIDFTEYIKRFKK